MNSFTHAFNKQMYYSGNKIRFNKNSMYKGIPEDKEKIVQILNDRYNISVQKSASLIGSKNLIYSCAFGIGFVMLFELLVKSLYKNTNIKEFDLLIVTDNITKKSIMAIQDLKHFKYHFHEVEIPIDGVEASMNKLKIFDFEKINDYNKILYLDADILCLKDISDLFNKEDETLDVVDNQYNALKTQGILDNRVISAATLTHSLCYFNKEQTEYIEKNDPLVFNAGQFLMTHSEQMRSHFDNIRWLTTVWPSAYFYEQSFMNHYFVLNKGCTYGKLNDATKLLLTNKEDEVFEPKENTRLIHFAGNTGSAVAKHKFIKNWMEEFCHANK